MGDVNLRCSDNMMEAGKMMGGRNWKACTAGLAQTV
jgi:hypothetical protein